LGLALEGLCEGCSGFGDSVTTDDDVVDLFYDLLPLLETLVRLNRMNEIAPHPSSDGVELFDTLGAIEQLLTRMDRR
jgi:hypothetical protein